MVDLNKLLTQVVSGISSQSGTSQSFPSDQGMRASNGGSRWPSAKQMSEQAHGMSGYGGAIGTGALAGGLASLLLGSKSMRKVAGSAVQIGAVAAIGGLAYKAFQNYRQGRPIVPQSIADMLAGATNPPRDPGVSQQPAIGAWIPPQDQSAGVSKLLLRAMIAAAAADGNLDAAEYDRIRQQLADSSLDAEEQLFLTQLIMRPSTVEELAAEAKTPELRAEVYAAARLAIDPDATAERDFLDRLATALKVEPGLRAHLDAIGDSKPAQAA